MEYSQRWLYNLGARRPATPDEWRILRALSLYRLILDILLLTLLRSHVGSELFTQLQAEPFYRVCVAYALSALLLLFGVMLRRPGLRWQPHLHFAIDALAVAALVYLSGGVSGGLAVLLITPALSCALVLNTRLAVAQAAAGTLLLFAAELLRNTHTNPGDFTGAALIGVILFGANAAASTVAARARKSEALAARVGSDLESLSRLNRRIIENLQTGILVVDERNHARLLNIAAKRLLGVRRDDDRIVLADVFPSMAATLDDWRRNPLRDAAPVVPRSGSPELLPRLMTLGHEPHASTLILLDETSRLREQAQQMKLAALGRLSASIAHEIRNPLSAIQQAAQLLAESTATFDTTEQRLLAIIDRQSARIEGIIRDVLSLSRRDPAMPVTLDLTQWLMRTLDIYCESFPARRAAIDLRGIPAQLYVHFDPSHLQQILFNLWDNSFTHSGRDPAELKISLRGGWTGLRQQPWLEIADNGDGIPQDLRERIFEPFFTTAHTGSGLGLYLARELCEYNQALLEYLPHEGNACFRVVFAVTAEVQH